MSLSGKRKKPIAPAGDGRLGGDVVELKCGHAAAGEPTVHSPSSRKSFWLCPDGCGFQERGRRAA